MSEQTVSRRHFLMRSSMLQEVKVNTQSHLSNQSYKIYLSQSYEYSSKVYSLNYFLVQIRNLRFFCRQFSCRRLRILLYHNMD